MKAGFAALGEVSEFIRGITFTPNDVEEVASATTVGVMRTKNVQEQLDLNDVWQIDRKFVKNKNQYLEEGDLLVSSANSWNLVGKASWIPLLNYESSFGGFVTVLRGNKKLIDRRYLYYWFVSDRIQSLLRSFSNKTTNISNLSLSRAKQLTIPLPPLAEQQRIAALLDTADRILKQRELAIAKLDQLAQSLFFQIDETASKHYKLNDISEIVSGATPKSEIKDYWNGDVHWATPAELGKLNDIFINQTVRRITNEGLASCAATLLPINSILFSSRAPIGHIAINTVPMATNQGFKSFIVDKQLIEPLYLYYWLSQNKLLLQSMGVGATFKELSKSIISAVKIKLPSIDEQKKFANTIGVIRNLKIKNLNAIEEIKNLLTSLQHQSFAVN